MPTFQPSRGGEAMISVEEAQARVMAEIATAPSERVAFADALGRVLREDVIANVDAPQADNSAMDGYAVCAEDVARASPSSPVRLRVVGDVPAGRLPEGRVERGTAMRIMTGAFVPDGADTVVQVELTDAGSDVVTVGRALPRGANIRRRGEDMHAGDLVLQRGARIGAAEIAMIAAVQKMTIEVARRPVVAILSTGDELVEADEPRPPGKIVNSNGYLLAALVTEAGATPRPLGVVRDTREATIAAFESALESDFVISSGGVSVGAYDFVKEALDALGAETRFWQVAMKPGKPVVVSRARDRVCFGLPGNPVSCFVSFHLFVAPALRKALGERGHRFPPEIRARLAAPVRGVANRRVYARALVVARGGELIATPLASQGSGSLTSMTGANGLVVVEPGSRELEPGAIAPVLLVGPLVASR